MNKTIKKPAPKDGLILKEGNARSYLATSAAKILKTSNPLAPSTKKSLERAVKRESNIAAANYEVIHKGAIIAKSRVFENTLKNKNGYKKLFSACKKADLTAAPTILRKLAKDHATGFSTAKLFETSSAPRERFIVSANIRGKSKPKIECSVYIWAAGKLYDVEMTKTYTVNDMIKNVKYTIKTLAKAT